MNKKRRMARKKHRKNILRLKAKEKKERRGYRPTPPPSPSPQGPPRGN